ncbi:hypothetical protein Hdeb2414_s0014g00425981 [Helianthus debilis subsp. tardiflorus]
MERCCCVMEWGSKQDVHSDWDMLQKMKKDEVLQKRKQIKRTKAMRSKTEARSAKGKSGGLSYPRRKVII